MQMCCEKLKSGELYDSSTVATYNIVPYAELKLKLWPVWESLISAVITGSAEQVSNLSLF